MALKDWIELAFFMLAVAGVLYRTGVMTNRFETIGKQQSEEIRELKSGILEFRLQTAEELKKITEILIDLADIRGQIGRMEADLRGVLGRVEDRVLQQGKRVDEVEKRLNRLYDNGAFRRES